MLNFSAPLLLFQNLAIRHNSHMPNTVVVCPPLPFLCIYTFGYIRRGTTRYVNKKYFGGLDVFSIVAGLLLNLSFSTAPWATISVFNDVNNMWGHYYVMSLC